MTRIILLVAALIAPATLAGAGEINHQARIGAAVRAGCTLQQVHTPAGKLVRSSPHVHCPQRAAAVLRGDVRADASAPRPRG